MKQAWKAEVKALQGELGPLKTQYRVQVAGMRRKYNAEVLDYKRLTDDAEAAYKKRQFTIILTTSK